MTPYRKSKKSHTSRGDQQAILYKFFIYFVNKWKKTNRVIVVSYRAPFHICQYSDHRCEFPIIWKTKLVQTYWKVYLICMKVQVHSSSEPPLEYHQDHTPLMSQGRLWPFLPTWELLEDNAISDNFLEEK